MFIELTEILRCPNGHPESYMVAAPMTMDGRRIVRGAVGCPECKAEYPILDGVVYFGAGESAAPPRVAPAPEYDVTALAAFLHLTGPGGYAVLVGAAARFAPALAAAVPGVHFVAVNPPPGVAPSAMVSLLRDPRGIPLRSAAVRGVALGGDAASPPWLGEAVRVLLPGLRLVIEADGSAPEGITELARGGGVLVGVREA